MAEEEKKEPKEQRWSCGCHEVNGKLVVECTDKVPTHELQAHHALNRPYSKVCFRKAVPVVVEAAEPEAGEAPLEAPPEPAPKPTRKAPKLADFDEDTK